MEGEKTDNSLASVLNVEELAQMDALKSILEAKNGYKVPTSDKEVLRFLRYRKNNVEEAAKAMLKFWRVFEKIRQHKKIMLPSPENLAETSRLFVLRERDKNGCQIISQNLGNWVPSKRTGIETFLLNFSITCTILDRQLTQLKGVVVVLDLDGFGSEHVLHSTLFQVKQCIDVLNSTPMIIKGVHFVNNPAIFGAVWHFFKLFLKEKIKKRVHFHGHNFAKTLHEHIEPKILPKCYGGPLENEDFGEEGFDELVLSGKPYFEDLLDESKYGYLK